jgi:hypothetical protein
MTAFGEQAFAFLLGNAVGATGHFHLSHAELVAAAIRLVQ